MLIEILFTCLVLTILLWAIYTSASAATQLFSMAERTIPEGKFGSGHRARFVEALSKNPQEILLAAALFKSLLFLFITVIVVGMVSRWASALNWPVSPFIVAGLVVVWLLRIWTGEILPKIAPSEHSERDDRPRLAGLALIWWGFRPLLNLTRWFTRNRPQPDRSADREEIVEHAIDALADSSGLDEPVIEPDERKMIQGIIGLEDTEVRQLMVPRIDIVAVSARATAEEVRRLVKESGHSRLPVYESDIDSIVGVIYAKDVFCNDDNRSVDLAALARRAFTVPETKKVDALLEEFKRRRTHIAIVVDEFGGTAGLVTLEDILEEIVGEIEDEHDPRAGTIEWINDHVIRVDGVVPLEDIAEALDWELPSDEFETIGGLIYDRVGGLPEPRQTITESGLLLTIEIMNGQRIKRVKIEKLPKPANGKP